MKWGWPEIEVKITADTRAFRRSLTRTRLILERSWWRRLLLRFELWRIDREKAPS